MKILQIVIIRDDDKKTNVILMTKTETVDRQVFDTDTKALKFIRDQMGALRKP